MAREIRYKQLCSKLLNQFKAAQNLTNIKTPADVKRFMSDYRVWACLCDGFVTHQFAQNLQLDCKAAMKRFEDGIPVRIAVCMMNIE
jgi:hypothetical protein